MPTMTETRQTKRRRGKPLLPRPILPLVLSLAAIELVRNGILRNGILAPLLRRAPRGVSNRIYAPRSLDAYTQRRLTLNLDGGNCGEWQPPPPSDASDEAGARTTILAGVPSGDRGAILEQMEALTGWHAKDEWDYLAEGASNHRLIASHYPHHEGTWAWGDAADQVVVMVHDLRKSLADYHDVLWDIGYAKIWEQARHGEEANADAPPIDEFYAWRDSRVINEISYYGWFIDYWMENGLMRDVYTHKVTTIDHWNMLTAPAHYSRDELDFDLVVGDRVVTPFYDPHCTSGELTGSCEPMEVISAESRRDYSEGPTEIEAVTNLLLNEAGKYAIGQEAWNCIFDELARRKRAPRAADDRPGAAGGESLNFSADVLNEMIRELDPLIVKYGEDEWSEKPAAHRLVELFVGYRASIQVEANEVSSGVRTLSNGDVLGPRERARRAREEGRAAPGAAADYFDGLYRRARSEKRKTLRDARLRARGHDGGVDAEPLPQ